MFEDFARYRAVLVTGPQRSGTTIAAKMIAADAGLRYVDESEWGVQDRAAWRRWVQDTRGAVMQCPSMSRYVHEFGHWDNVAVVWMRRSLKEIAASEKRVGWGGSDRAYELARYGVKEGNIAKLKYRYWREVQREKIVNAYEVKYASLEGHPLWVDAADRVGFEVKQTA